MGAPPAATCAHAILQKCLQEDAGGGMKRGEEVKCWCIRLDLVFSLMLIPAKPLLVISGKQLGTVMCNVEVKCLYVMIYVSR